MSLKKHDQLPDFLIIGAGKSGTTSLDNYLKQHPDIFIPELKEPNFYGYELTKIADFNGDQGEINHYKSSVTNLEDYLKLFKGAKPGQKKGETSNTYMYHKDAPTRIKYYIPDVKLVAILRQPAERLYSRYLHLARENRVPTNSFSDCLDKDTIWWKRNDLIKEGFYYKNILPYYELFPKENIKVILYEEFNSQPGKVLKDLYNFLGVDSEFKNDTSIKYNESGIIKNKFIDKIYGQNGIVKNAVRSLIPNTLLQKIKSNDTFQRNLSTLRGNNLVRPKFDPNLKSQLTKEVYHSDILQLQELIGRDITSQWVK